MRVKLLRVFYAAFGVLLLVLLALTLLDLAGTLTGILKVRSHVKRQSLLYEVSENLQRTADMMGQGLTKLVLRRMERAYPALNVGELLKARREQEQKKKEARMTMLTHWLRRVAAPAPAVPIPMG